MIILLWYILQSVVDIISRRSLTWAS